MKILLVLALIPLLHACSGDSPSKVSEAYWEAVKQGDPGAQFIADPSQLEGWEMEKGSLLDVKLGEETVINNIAHVKTTATFKEGDSIRVREYSTHLVSIEDQWKIDFNNTMSSMIGFDISQLGNQFGEAMSQAFGSVAEELGKGMKEAMEALGQGFKEVAKEMEKEIDAQTIPDANDSGNASE